jgi:hypothetical protein
MSCHHHQPPSYPELNYGSGAKWVKSLTQSRLNTFTGGHFADVNLSSVLFTHRVDSSSYVKLQVWSAPGLSKPLFEEAMKQEFKPAKKGDSFGPSCKSWSTYSVSCIETHISCLLPGVSWSFGCIFSGIHIREIADKSLVEGFYYHSELLGAI